MRDQMLKFVKRNSATILTCVSAIGVVGTAISAAKATPKAIRMLEKSKKEKGDDLTKLEIVKVAGPAYIPTLLLGASTIACVFGANTLNKRQQASLVSAYTLLDSSYKEYKAKIKNMYGDEADVNVRKEIAKDHYEKEDLDFEFEGDTELFYDEFSESYFEATLAEVIKAEYELNRRMAVNTGVYLNEWYELLNNPAVPEIPAGQELGWSSGILESHYWANWIEFDHTKVEMDDGLECTIVSFRYEPVIDFAYY